MFRFGKYLGGLDLKLAPQYYFTAFHGSCFYKSIYESRLNSFQVHGDMSRSAVKIATDGKKSIYMYM